jgi:isocitrate dehydrogenase (NAD+)
VIFRQNTEGLYGGVEWTNPPEQVRAALATHPKFKRSSPTCPARSGDLDAHLHARRPAGASAGPRSSTPSEFGYKSVTICEKPNVIRETSGMLTAEVKELAAEYPGIELWETNIDAQMMWLTKNPEDYGVIVAGNMFGDIVSDGFAGLVGGLGFACSANIGDEVAVFEPTHGSAPKYEKLDPPIVNPIAMILSACMMLDHIGETDKRRPHPRRHRQGHRSRGQGPAAYDMLKLKGGPRSRAGRRHDDQMTDAVIANL